MSMCRCAAGRCWWSPPGTTTPPDLAALRRFIRECRPVLIGVEAGADALYAAGYRPQLVVGDPTEVGTETLKCGAEVVIPAYHDGYAPGLERIQDLGIGAVTFPAMSNPEDLALLLAEAHDAALVITVGFQSGLPEFLDRGRSGSTPSTFLTRLKLGSKVVDGRAVAALYHGRVSAGAALLMVSAAALAGRAGSADGDGPVGVVRADTASAALLSTVDDVGTAAGRVVTVLALAEQTQGRAGRYGTAGNAQAMVPSTDS